MKKIFLLMVSLSLILFFNSCDTSIDEAQAELHHIFPQEMRQQFADKGINVDDFTIRITKKDHRLEGGIQYNPANWNKEMAEYCSQNPNATEKDLYGKAQKMLQNAGFKGKLNFYNYKTRKASTAKLAGSVAMVVTQQGGILGFFGTLGDWLIKLFGGFSFGSTLIAFLASIGVTVLGWFGIKAEEPVAVGVGFVVCLFAIACFIGVCYCLWLLYQYYIVAGAAVVGGGTAAVVSNK